MFDKKQALDVMGLEENADREIIKKKYDLLLKKYHYEEVNDMKKKSINLDEINEAYKILLADNDVEIEDEPQTTEKIIFNKACNILKIDEKKAENFIHYNKYKVLGIAFAIIMTILIVATISNYDRPDLKVVYIGNYSGEVSDKFLEKIKTTMPEIKKPEIRIIPLILTSGVDRSANVNNMKVTTLLRANDIDLAIMDKEAFMNYLEFKAFIPLDEFKTDKEKNKQFIFKNKETGKMSLYAVEIKNYKFMKQDNINGKDKIAAILYNGINIENAKKLLNKILAD